MSEECDHNAIHCECGHQQDIEEAVIAERKRIIALARAKVVEFERNLTHRGDPYDDGYHDGIQEFANELEAEDG